MSAVYYEYGKSSYMKRETQGEKKNTTNFNLTLWVHVLTE